MDVAIEGVLGIHALLDLWTKQSSNPRCKNLPVTCTASYIHTCMIIIKFSSIPYLFIAMGEGKKKKEKRAPSCPHPRTPQPRGSSFRSALRSVGPGKAKQLGMARNTPSRRKTLRCHYIAKSFRLENNMVLWHFCSPWILPLCFFRQTVLPFCPCRWWWWSSHSCRCLRDLLTPLGWLTMQVSKAIEIIIFLWNKLAVKKPQNGVKKAVLFQFHFSHNLAFEMCDFNFETFSAQVSLIVSTASWPFHVWKTLRTFVLSAHVQDTIAVDLKGDLSTVQRCEPWLLKIERKHSRSEFCWELLGQVIKNCKVYCADLGFDLTKGGGLRCTPQALAMAQKISKSTASICGWPRGAGGIPPNSNLGA